MRRSIIMGLLALLAPTFAAAQGPPERRPLPPFDRIVIDDDFPGGYQVEVADVDGDGRPDLVALGGDTCAWYENPSWTKRIVTGPDEAPAIISSATADLDGDGKAEIAIAYDFEMKTPTRGKLGLAIQGISIDDPWTFRPIADVPSIHRIRWGDIDGDRRPDLVAAPIFGPDAEPPIYEEPAVVSVFAIGDDPMAVIWERRAEGPGFPVIHAIEVRPDPLNPIEAADVVLTADNLGVHALRYPVANVGQSIRQIAPGAVGEAPARGSSEVHFGRRSRSDRLGFLATIEPWHGNELVVYTPITRDNISTRPNFGLRTVIDDTLDQGHALWVADVDGDGEDEVFAGHRGKDHRVSAYDFDGRNWNRTVLDAEIAAQDLRGGDLDGDGTPDVVAIGGSTHNLIWYRPRPTDEE